MLEGTLSEAVLRLLLALISGGLIGYERSRKRIDAGFRTHIFVCMSACAIMITNIHIYMHFQTGDPVRMPAQVISGVGFLGAGCILVTGQRRIKGVTTAAGLWSAACLGLCIGAGDYIVALVVLVLALLTITVFKTVDKKLVERTKYMRLYVELESVSAVSNIIRHMREQEIEVNDIDFLENTKLGNLAMVVTFRLKKADTVKNIVMDFETVNGVLYASGL